MKLKKIVIFLLVFLPSIGHSAWTEQLEIEYIKIQHNGVYLKLLGFVKADAEIDCEKSGFWIPLDSDNFEIRSSTLLDAFMSSRKVEISYYECASTGDLAISSVALSRY